MGGSLFKQIVMCLITTQRRPCEAKKDIVVYKVLRRMILLYVPEQTNPVFGAQLCRFEKTPLEWKTPFYELEVDSDGWLIPNTKAPEESSKIHGGDRAVREGYIHCYYDRSMLSYLTGRVYANNGLSYSENAVFVGIIPKGEKYYIGTNGEICATAVKLDMRFPCMNIKSKTINHTK